ncbi:MAG: complex I subunit 5 family protein [Sulfolobales archaeon]|nr:complex I subunit 5 family protein [Sulfolobales archaeon]MDW8082919.1 complex I subunit 5 family protein [Sulfolobales archaeon]
MSDVFRYAVYAISIAFLLAGNVAFLRARKTGFTLRALSYLVLLLLLYNWYLEVFPSILLVVSVVTASLVTLYTPSYSTRKYGVNTLQPLIDFFTLSTVLVFTSKYLVEIVAFWLIAEILGFFVVVYDAMVGTNPRAWSAGLRYLVVSMVPADLSLLLLLALAGLGPSMSVPVDLLELDLTSPVLTAVAMLGFMAKAAVAPLHFWLPDAHSMAPSPGSAVLSGLMVKMGLYGLFRLALLRAIDIGTAVAICLVFGSLTAIYGGLQALVQSDIKRILAYSTISHTSTITILVGLYMYSRSPEFLTAAAIYSAAHAIYKSSLFMDSGVVELLTHTRTLERLGYVSRILPAETLSALLAALSLIGVPPTLGFLTKLVVFMTLASHIPLSWVYLLITLVIAFEVALSIGYSVRYLLAHMGNPTFRYEELDPSSAKLTPYVLTLSASSLGLTYYVVGSIASTTLANMMSQILLLLGLFSALFAIAGWITYTVLKHGRKDEVWLGGARP